MDKITITLHFLTFLSFDGVNCHSRNKTIEWCESGHLSIYYRRNTGLAIDTWSCPDGSRLLWWDAVCDGNYNCLKREDETYCIEHGPHIPGSLISNPQLVIIRIPEKDWCHVGICYVPILHDAYRLLAHSLCQQMHYLTYEKFFGIGNNTGIPALSTEMTNCRLNAGNSIHSCLRRMTVIPFNTSCTQLLAVVCTTDCVHHINVPPGSVGQLTSPGFPNYMLYNMECYWLLISEQGVAFKIQFLTLSLQEKPKYENRCTGSYVEFGLGPIRSKTGLTGYRKVRLCDDSIVLQKFNSTFHRVWFRYVTTGYPSVLRGSKGFLLRYATYGYNSSDWVYPGDVRNNSGNETATGLVPNYRTYASYHGQIIGASIAGVGLLILVTIGIVCFLKLIKRQDRTTKLRQFNSRGPRQGSKEWKWYRFFRYHTPPGSDQHPVDREEYLFTFTAISCIYCNIVVRTRLEACSHIKALLQVVCDPSFVGPRIPLDELHRLLPGVITDPAKRVPDAPYRFNTVLHMTSATKPIGIGQTEVVIKEGMRSNSTATYISISQLLGNSGISDNISRCVSSSGLLTAREISDSFSNLSIVRTRSIKSTSTVSRNSVFMSSHNFFNGANSGPLKNRSSLSVKESVNPWSPGEVSTPFTAGQRVKRYSFCAVPSLTNMHTPRNVPSASSDPVQPPVIVIHPSSVRNQLAPSVVKERFHKFFSSTTPQRPTPDRITMGTRAVPAGGRKGAPKLTRRSKSQPTILLPDFLCLCQGNSKGRGTLTQVADGNNNVPESVEDVEIFETPKGDLAAWRPQPILERDDSFPSVDDTQHDSGVSRNSSWRALDALQIPRRSSHSSSSTETTHTSASSLTIGSWAEQNDTESVHEIGRASDFVPGSGIFAKLL